MANNRLLASLVWLSAAAFVASWFLPVLDDVPGWMAFRYALAPLVPYRDAGNQAWEDNVPQVLSALTNVMYVILLGLWLAKQMFRPGLFVRIALACLLLDLYWFVQAWRAGHHLADLLYGYYVWIAAFALMLAVAAVTAFEARRTSRTPRAGTPA
ncbi:MAG TPA: hypothetical protein VM146_06070 [Steroidobacteraceae bacterium]|nr:hypothetical protein [Steroidobacteraceae bacterium]